MKNKEWLTPCEVAEYLSISKRTVYRLIDDGALQAISIRRAKRIKTKSVKLFIHEQQQIQALKSGI